MAQTDDPEYRYENSRNRLTYASGVTEHCPGAQCTRPLVSGRCPVHGSFEGDPDVNRDPTVSAADHDAILEVLDALDPEISATSFTGSNGKRETKTYGTLAAYCQALKRVCELADGPLTDVDDVRDVNELFDRLADGYGSSTLSQWQSAVTKFYEYHADLGVDPADIVVTVPKSKTVDERDMYTAEEVDALRDAVTNSRDRCLLELFLNTGQRIRAIQTLRVKDVDPQEGVYWLNTADGGLKGADENGAKRPLLGAKRAVYDWLKDHPTGDPDDYLITVLPTANRGVAGTKLSQSNIRRRLQIIADEAEVSKPPNPHNFRHHFVTVCKRDYKLDDATIKFLIGHPPESNIMESTYSHMSAEDHIKEAEIAADLREPEPEDSPLTPRVCPTCTEPLSPSAKACAGCGTVFTPDAKAAEDAIQAGVTQANREVDPGDVESIELLDALEETLGDLPAEHLEALLDRAVDRTAD